MTNEHILAKAIEKYGTTKKGNVFNRKSGNWLKPGTYRNGYKYICVCMGNGVTKKVKVHRLVAIEHIPNPENKPHINHKDSNPSNNAVRNLEWCTAKENVIHGFRMGRQQWNKGKLSKSQIYRLCKRTPRRMFWVLTTNDFQLAKAFWGEERIALPLFSQLEDGSYQGTSEWAWAYHLQQIAILTEDDKFKYLEKFL